MIFAQSFNWKTWTPLFPPTLDSSSAHTWQLNIPFTSAIYTAPLPLVSLTCVAWVKCPTERHRFGEFSGTTNPQKWQAIGLYGEKRNTVKLTGYPDSTLGCPSPPFLSPSVSHYVLFPGSCLVHFVALQDSWIDSSFYIDNRSSTFSAHRRFVATFWLSVDYHACNLLTIIQQILDSNWITHFWSARCRSPSLSAVDFIRWFFNFLNFTRGSAQIN